MGGWVRSACKTKRRKRSPYGPFVVYRGHRNNLVHPQRVATVTQRRRHSFASETLAPPLRQKCIAHISVRQAIALEEPAHADGSVAVHARHCPQTVTVLRLHRKRTVPQVPLRVQQRVHVAITDVAQPRLVVEELENEGSVCEGKVAQHEAVGAQDAALFGASAVRAEPVGVGRRRFGIVGRCGCGANFWVHFNR
jgi:hypothetical protein